MENRLFKILRTYFAFMFIVILFSGGIINAQTATAPSGSGTSGDPYLIATLDNLYWVTQNSGEWGKHYKQTANIDASSTSSWDGGNGFTPIGNGTIKFTGSYDGDGHKISNLYINRSSYNLVGLFGRINGAEIKNIGLENVNISGTDYVGGLVGAVDINGTITNSYSTGSVSGANSIGGLVGFNFEGTITNSYSTGSVSGDDFVGGLVGFNNWGTITNNYSTGSVSGTSEVGGLIGYNVNGIITTCFWDTETSGTITGVGAGITTGATGKTTAEMKTLSTFTNGSWDFTGEITNGTDDIWSINGSFNSGYPYLTWQMSSNTAPTASDNTVNPNEEQTFTFSASDFQYSDADSDPLTHIQITSEPTAGNLFVDLNDNGTNDGGSELLPSGSTVTKANLDANRLKYIPDGLISSSFIFKVNDGTDYSTSSYTMMLTVNAKPTVTINQASGQNDPTNSTTINFTVVFSEAVTGFATGDVTLGGTAGATTGTVSETAPDDGTTYNVAVTGMTGDGTITATIAAGISTDAGSTTNKASTSTDNSVTYDNTAPTITISTIAVDDIINGTEDDSDVTISGTTSGADDGRTVTVGLNGLTYTSTVNSNAWNVTVPAADVQALGASETVTADVSDIAGNSATQATKNISHDLTPPTITINTIAVDDIINGTEDNSDVTISGTTSGAEDGRTVTVGLNGLTYTGTVNTNAWSVTVPAADVQTLDASETVTADVSDLAGNAATQTTKNIIYDTVAPTITISTIAGDDIINATEDNSNVTISGTTSGAEDGRGVTVGLNGKTYNGNVSSDAWSITVPSADVQALAASETVTADVSDLADNAATQATQNITRDTDIPTVSISSPSVTVTESGPVIYNITYSGASTINLTTGNITLNKSGTADGTVLVNNGTTVNPTVTVNNISGVGSIGISITAGTSSDAAGNLDLGAGPSAVFSLNTAPAVSSVSGQTINEDDTLSLKLDVKDIDGNGLSYTSQSSKGEVKTYVIDGTLYAVPSENWNGETEITVDVNDGNTSTTAKFKLTVAAVNDAPDIALIENVYRDEDDTAHVPLTVSDAEGDKLSFIIISSNENVSVEHAEGYLILTPKAEWSGTAHITINVSDGELTSQRTFPFIVSSVNDAPAVSFQLSPFTFNEDEGITFTNSELYPFINDPDNADSTLSITFSYGGDNLVIETMTDSSISIRSKENWFGLDTVTVNVSDGSLTTNAPFAINVISVNDIPEFVNLPETINFINSVPIALDVYKIVSDIETPDDLLQFEFSTITDSLLYNYDSEKGLLNLNTLVGFSGETVLTIKATDENGGVSEISINVIVENNITGIEDLTGIPEDYELSQNYPNPFNPSTKIRYGLPNESKVHLVIYNILGQEVAVLKNTTQSAGYHEVEWNASRLSSGMYIYRLTAESTNGQNKYTQVKKMLMIK